MRRFLVVALAAALGLAGSATAQFTVTYSEDFDDGAAAGRFSAPVVDAETGAFDGEVDFAFDYGAIGIPSAPSSGGSTTGVLFEVNLSDAGDTDEGESVAVVPTVPGSELPEGDYIFSVEAFFNAEFESSGSTEYGIFGVHATDFNAPGDDAVNDDVPFRFGLSNGNGLAWSATGEAGASDDFFRFEDAGNADTGTQTALGSYDDIPAGSIPGISTGAGALGPEGVWAEFSITRVGDSITFAINGVAINTFEDTGGLFTGGTVLLGYNDAFNSVGTPDLPVGPDPNPLDDIDFGDEFPDLAHFVIFDNVTITAIPEPGAMVLGLFALGGLAAGRRR